MIILNFKVNPKSYFNFNKIHYLYHGSPNYYDILTPMDRHKPAKMVGAAVYATPNPAFALCFAGNSWNDKTFNLGFYNGQLTLTGLKPNAINEIYNRSGYIYTITDLSNFQYVYHGNKYTPHELYSYKPVNYSNVEKIDNVLDTILNKSNIEIYYYPNKPKWWKEIFPDN